MTAGSLHRPGVSLDVLVRVMNILVEEDSFPAEEAISAMSQTCRYLRTEFIRRLLTGTVRVNTFDQPEIIAPFCQFVLNDPIFRIPLLRRFKINVHHLMEDAARAFADLLSLASHLEHLEIDSLLEVTKTVAAIICSALSSLTSLKHLTVEHCKSDDPSYHSMFYHTFQTMQSHLTSVEVILPAIKTPSPRILYMRYQDPIFILSRLAGSLRSVRLEGTTRLGGGIRVFPLVEELQITNHIKGMPDLRTYILSFPNLRRLRCGITNSYWIRYRHTTNTLNVPCGLASVKEWHDYNKQDSTRHNRGWGSLQTFRGSIIDAYVLSCLPCHGIRLHLLSTGGTRSSEEIMLSTILSETRPSSLRLCLKVYKARGYIPILPPHSFWAESLTELEIRINIVQHSFDLDECFVCIVAMIQASYLDELTNLIDPYHGATSPNVSYLIPLGVPLCQLAFWAKFGTPRRPQ